MSENKLEVSEVEGKVSASLLAQIDGFIDKVKNLADTTLAIREEYTNLMNLAIQEGLTVDMFRTLLNAKIKPLMSNYKYYKLLGAIFRPEKEKTAETTGISNNESTTSNLDNGNPISNNDGQGSALPELDRIQFPCKLLQKIPSDVDFVYLLVGDGEVKDISIE